jgi:hypothetical protein
MVNVIDRSRIIKGRGKMTVAKKRVSKEAGQSLMEFAISFIIFVILIAGIIDLGRLFFTYMALRDAAQEGAAYGSVNPMRYNDIHNRVRGISNLPVDFTSEGVTLNVEIDYEDGPCAGQEIIVTVSTNYLITMPLIGSLIGTQTIPLSATATDHILRPPCSGY